jgi:glycosyltransferase involved in cell wall biosynthesis
MHDFSTGGSERIAIRLANQWARCGRRITILCGTLDGPARALVAPEIRVRSVQPEIRRNPLSRLLLARALAEPVIELNPDLIFAPGNFHIPVIGMLGRTLGSNRPALICKLSNPLRQPGRSSPAQWLFESLTRWHSRPVDALVVMAATLRDEAMAVLHHPQIRLIYEPNVDSYAPEALPAPCHPPGAPLILCAGRLVPQKNFALAIQALALLDRERNARLLILGEGAERAALEAEVERHGLAGRVVFTGHVADIRPALASAQLFLLSSRYEGYPAVLIEALAAGLPVVTTDCSPAIGEIMAHPSFGRVTAQDAPALASAIESVLREDLPQPGEVAALLDRHRLDRVAQSYLDLFDQTVAIRSRLADRS